MRRRGSAPQRVEVCRQPWNAAQRQQRRDAPVQQVWAPCQQAPNATGQARGIRGRLQARLRPRLPTCWLAGASVHSFLVGSHGNQKSTPLFWVREAPENPIWVLHTGSGNKLKGFSEKRTLPTLSLFCFLRISCSASQLENRGLALIKSVTGQSALTTSLR